MTKDSEFLVRLYEEQIKEAIALWLQSKGAHGVITVSDVRRSANEQRFNVEALVEVSPEPAVLGGLKIIKDEM